MRPRIVTVPIRRLGTPASGRAKDALIRMPESLTAGSRCRICPLSQASADGGSPAAAKRSAGIAASIVAPKPPARNRRRSHRMTVSTSSHSLTRGSLQPDLLKQAFGQGWPLGGELMDRRTNIGAELSGSKSEIPDLAHLRESLTV